MTTKSNLTLVKKIYEAFGEGDIPKVLEMLDHNIQWRIIGPSDCPFFGTFSGHKGFHKFLDQLGNAADIHTFEPKRFLEAGNAVVVTGIETATTKNTKISYTTEWCHIFTVEGEKVVSFEEYLDSAPLVAAYDNREGA